MKKELQEPLNQYIYTEHFGYRDQLPDLQESALDQNYHLGPHQSTVQHLRLCIVKLCMIKTIVYGNNKHTYMYAHTLTYNAIVHTNICLQLPSNERWLWDGYT